MAGLNLREYFKISLIYVSIAAVPPALQLLAMPLIEGNDRLTAIDFSHLAIVESIIVLVFMLSLYSMGNAIARFYYDYKENSKESGQLISSVILSILFRGMVLLGIGILFGDRLLALFSQSNLHNFSSFGYAAIITGINRAIIAASTALLRNQKKVALFAVINLSLGILRTAFQLYIVIQLQTDFSGYVLGTAIGSSMTSIFVLIYLFKKHGIKYSHALMKPVYVFSRPLIQYTLLSWVLLFADRYFLKFQHLDIQLAIYDTAIKYAAGVQIILQGVQGATQPELYRLMKDGMKKNQHSINQLGSILMIQSELIIVAAILPIMVFLDFTMETEIHQAAYIVPIVLMTQILRSQFVAFSYGIYYRKKTVFFLYTNSIALIVNLALNYLLVAKIGYYGSIIALAASILIQVFASFVYQQKLSGIKWNKTKLLWFPLLIVLFSGILEIIRLQYGISHYYAPFLIILFVILGILFIYRNDYKAIKNQLLKKQTPAS